MNITELIYPVFEANQVLTNAHLNELFSYLDDQQRLTRANLIGIGIACGLEASATAEGRVRLSRGVGVTSDGYLILEPGAGEHPYVDLTWSAPYTVPDEDGYLPLKAVPGMRQLFPGDPGPAVTGAAPLADGGIPLADQAVVLFLELRRTNLRNCSANNCDDRGAQVTATLRPLLVRVDHLDALVADNPAADLTERLDLPDLRMPRVDVPSTNPVQPQEVLAAFQAGFRQHKLVAATIKALDALYSAFKPVLGPLPGDPTPFEQKLGPLLFLDTVPTRTADARFVQYHWDFFDDLITAYDEVRAVGTDLFCACCPSGDLFPRHLLAGLLGTPVGRDPADYRHHWLPSPAVGSCEDRTTELRLLMDRLVRMVDTFFQPADPEIRITPSRWGTGSLGDKAIPYYYSVQDTARPVYEVWNTERTHRRRANHNLSYRAPEYTPAPPPFVREPLQFDLEPNNFLRVEGHLGRNVHQVLKELDTLRTSRRLPIDVIALRAGTFDEKFPIDLSTEQCRFEDLETLYETLKAELICVLVDEVKYFYQIPVDPNRIVLPGPNPVSRLWLLHTYAPDYYPQPGTIGRLIEDHLSGRTHWIFVLEGDPDLANQVLGLVTAMSDLAAVLGDDVRNVDFAALAARYQTLLDRAARMEGFRAAGNYDRVSGMAERLDDILFGCRLDPFEALAEEYRRRVVDLKRSQYLGHFLEHHPGVQHKAGVPLGGTFVLVYHEAQPSPRRDLVAITAADEVIAAQLPALSSASGELTLSPEEWATITKAFTSLAYDERFVTRPEVQAATRALGLDLVFKWPPFLNGRIFAQAVSELASGAVIADFFLPYHVCSGCAVIQCSPPPPQLGVGTRQGCTRADGTAEVKLDVTGAVAPLSVRVDGGGLTPTDGTLRLTAGTHSIVVRDVNGAESAPVQVTVPPHLTITEVHNQTNDATGTFTVDFVVAGGTAPYSADRGTFVGSTYTSPSLPIDQLLVVQVEDNAGCTVSGTFKADAKPCTLPCGGDAIQEGLRFWAPQPQPQGTLYSVALVEYQVMDPGGNPHNLTAAATGWPSAPVTLTTLADFQKLTDIWLAELNRLADGVLGIDRLLAFSYQPPVPRSTTGTLLVDRIVCVDFFLRLDVTIAENDTKRTFEVSYNSKGTVIRDERGASEIPPFNVIDSNRCRPEQPPVPRCKSVDFTLSLRRAGTHPRPVELTAVPGGNDVPVAYVWEVQDATPVVGFGQTVPFQFKQADPPTKRVRVTAYTNDGCVRVLDTRINITTEGG